MRVNTRITTVWSAILLGVSYLLLLAEMRGATLTNDTEIAPTPPPVMWSEDTGMNDFYARGVPLDRFNWDFLFDSASSWPFAHVVNPLCVYMLTQSTGWTFLIFIMFEPFETWLLVFFRGNYVIFIKDKPAPESEPTTDSLIGDVLGGVIGWALGKIIMYTYKVPTRSPSMYSGYRRIAIKRFLELVFIEFAFLGSNANLELSEWRPFRYGSLFIIFWLTLCYVLFVKWDWTTDEIALVWSGKSKENAKRDFHIFYSAWFGSAIVITMGSLVFVAQGYFQLWAICACVAAFHLTSLALQNRMDDLWFAIQMGNSKRAMYYKQQAVILTSRALAILKRYPATAVERFGGSV